MTDTTLAPATEEQLRDRMTEAHEAALTAPPAPVFDPVRLPTEMFQASQIDAINAELSERLAELRALKTQAERAIQQIDPRWSDDAKRQEAQRIRGEHQAKAQAIVGEIGAHTTKAEAQAELFTDELLRLGLTFRTDELENAQIEAGWHRKLSRAAESELVGFAMLARAKQDAPLAAMVGREARNRGDLDGDTRRKVCSIAESVPLPKMLSAAQGALREIPLAAREALDIYREIGTGQSDPQARLSRGYAAKYNR